MQTAVDLMPTARRIVEHMLKVQPSEQATVVTDWERPYTITTALASCLRYAGAEVVVVSMTPRDHGGIDPPPAVAGAIFASQVVIMQTSFATIHTQTIRQALAKGVRVCEFWGITEDMMLRGGLTEDPGWLEKTTLRFAELLEKASKARLTTAQGTDLSFDLKGRRAMSMAGSFNEPWIGLPGGEAAISPVEGTTEGKLVAPYLVEHREIGRPKEHLEFTVRAGNVEEVKGGIEAQRLKMLLSEVSGSRNVAELAIGTNRRCRLEAGLREAKRAWGTAHVALGDNRTVGGSVQSQLHIDFILTEPTIWLDGRQVVRDGKLLD